MELLFALALLGTGILMVAGIRGMKPETAAQRRQRLYREAAREDRQFHPNPRRRLRPYGRRARQTQARKVQAQQGEHQPSYA